MAQYIDKAALVDEIERSIELNDTCQKISGGHEFYRGVIDEAKEILSFIDSLEVREVDLDKEIEEYLRTFSSSPDNGIEYSKKLARYFFELGLKVAQKGE